MDCQLSELTLDLLSDSELEISINSVIFLTSCLFLGAVLAVGGLFIEELDDGAIDRKPSSDTILEFYLLKVLRGDGLHL